jgi:hypothetical protein
MKLAEIRNGLLLLARGFAEEELLRLLPLRIIEPPMALKFT